MDKLTIRVAYIADIDIKAHWVETGELINTLRVEIVSIDTGHQRAIINKLGVLDDVIIGNKYKWTFFPGYYILGKGEFRPHVYEEILLEFDHLLTHDEIWELLEKDSIEAIKKKDE